MTSYYADIYIRRFTLRLLRTLFIAVLSLQLFSACGLKAPLYLPQEPPQPQQPQKEEEQPAVPDQSSQPDRPLSDERN